MPRKKPPLNAVPISPWLHGVGKSINYFVHLPTKRCGIHSRNLSELCGVHHSTIQGVLRNAQKTGRDLAGLRESKIHNLLKNRDIFLEDLAGLSPILNGKPVKVVLSDVYFDIASYYAMEGRKEAIKTVTLMGRFGTEQFIFIQVGFIPRPESIMLDEIEYLIAKETVQVNKSRQEEARFFTNPTTGECGIALESLGFLCGGVAIKHVQAFLAAHNEPFLNPEQPEPIVKAPICATVLQHFGQVHKPRKTVAQHWAATLDPIVPTLHQKTHYQAPLP